MANRENERNVFLGEESLHIYQVRLQSAKKSAEGYAVQFLITNEADFAGVKSFLIN